VARIKLVKPEKAAEIETRLIMQARSGSIREKVEENEIIRILQIIGGSEKQTKVKVCIYFG
jgi:DNA-binding TFAR19-related protein (PDSD5 family)